MMQKGIVYIIGSKRRRHKGQVGQEIKITRKIREGEKARATLMIMNNHGR